MCCRHWTQKERTILSFLFCAISQESSCKFNCLKKKEITNCWIAILSSQWIEFKTYSDNSASPYLSSLLNGVGHLMTNITEGQLIETAQLLLNLWTFVEDPIKSPPKIEVLVPPQKPTSVTRVLKQTQPIKRSPTSNSSETAVLQVRKLFQLKLT